MAKDQFIRTKPHVNVSMSSHRLREVGVTAQGAQQVLHGQIVSDANDRALVAEIVMHAVNQDGIGSDSW